MSKRGHYIGGHSLVFGSASKDEDTEFWADAKTRVDAVHHRGLAREGEIREKLDAIEARRTAVREGILNGSIRLKDAEQVVRQIQSDGQLLKEEAGLAGVRFSPNDGIGRTLILISELLGAISYIRDHEDENAIEEWSDLL